MIEINGKVYRNIQEQVAENKKDIEELQGYIGGQTYTRTEIDNKDAAVLQEAKEYATLGDNATLQSANQYAVLKKEEAITAANAYSDTQNVTQNAELKAYTDTQVNAATVWGEKLLYLDVLPKTLEQWRVDILLNNIDKVVVSYARETYVQESRDVNNTTWIFKGTKIHNMSSGDNTDGTKLARSVVKITKTIDDTYYAEYVSPSYTNNADSVAFYNKIFMDEYYNKTDNFKKINNQSIIGTGNISISDVGSIMVEWGTTTAIDVSGNWIELLKPYTKLNVYTVDPIDSSRHYYTFVAGAWNSTNPQYNQTTYTMMARNSDDVCFYTVNAEYDNQAETLTLSNWTQSWLSPKLYRHQIKYQLKDATTSAIKLSIRFELYANTDRAATDITYNTILQNLYDFYGIGQYSMLHLVGTGYFYDSNNVKHDLQEVTFASNSSSSCLAYYEDSQAETYETITSIGQTYDIVCSDVITYLR